MAVLMSLQVDSLHNVYRNSSTSSELLNNRLKCLWVTTAEMTNLQLRLSYSQSGGELLPYKDVRVVRLREHPLQLVQLIGSVGSPAPLGPADGVLQLIVITEFIIFLSFLTVTIGGSLRGTAVGRLKEANLPIVVVLISTYRERRSVDGLGLTKLL